MKWCIFTILYDAYGDTNSTPIGDVYFTQFYELYDFDTSRGSTASMDADCVNLYVVDNDRCGAASDDANFAKFHMYCMVVLLMEQQHVMYFSIGTF